MTNPRPRQPNPRTMRFVPQHILLFILILLPAFATATPKPAIAISQAKWAKGVLSVKGTVRHSAAASVDLYDGSGRLLGQATVDGRHRFALRRTDLDRPELLCSVQAKATDATATAQVKGKPKSCGKVPQCKILSPVGSLAVMVNSDVSFSAKATLKDRKAEPLKMEWDFGGGSMGETTGNPVQDSHTRPTGTEATVQFIRDNSRYRVRFTAWDKQNRYCEDSVEVVVGTPPDTLETFQETLQSVNGLAQASVDSAPPPASAVNAPADALVVLPYQDWTMQTASDSRTVPNAEVVYGPQVDNINAAVYQKARKPVVVGQDRVELKYSAATNPADPVGPNSINSTSQNWPLDTPLKTASIPKGDLFESFLRPAGTVLPEGYYSSSFVNFLNPKLASMPDEGYHDSESTPPLNPDHGQYMPGIKAPYAVNDPQPFGEYVTDDNRFAARMLPLTDIDDQGRVNPFPLFRIEATQVGGKTPVAATDIVANSARDFQCRECHAKGKIASNPESPTIPGISFVDAESGSLFDQEYAADYNTLASFLHPAGGDPSYPRPYSLGLNLGIVSPIINDGPSNCSTGSSGGGCHSTAYKTTAFGQPLGRLADDTLVYNYSRFIHSVHSRLAYNADKSDVVRAVPYTTQVRFNPENNWGPATGSTRNTLFPVKDATGKILPMEDNCLKCHGGQREQSYRDRMYTSGVTCYQCHGDVWGVAMGIKSSPGPDGRIYREPWIDEPDCGSCHTGNANLGQSGNDEYFSGGVRKLAFNKDDMTATPYRPDPLNPDEIRFAVPLSDLVLNPPDTTVTQTRLYRAGKDNHGKVACAACHGPAHGIWPNRDPSANDNVTARQLQGHSGPIAECSVCHTVDAFANFEDLDEGVWPVDAKVGVLGGPHNMHPVNDPNWWQTAAGDSPNSDGTTKGGWHNDYAKTPGRLGEDQCAACHGNDHLGTQLSKTPVDREFVTAKGKRIKVKAGTEIGCNLCHNVEKSCTGSPSGADCGKTSDKVTQSPNRAPVFTSSVDTTVVMGRRYQHTVAATDPDGDPVSYHLDDRRTAPELNLDPATGAISMPARMSNLFNAPHPSPEVGHSLLYQYYVVAQDSHGAQTTQLVRVFADCQNQLAWDNASQTCVKIKLASTSPIDGLNPGQTYRYPVIAEQRSGEPLIYRLSGQPTGMTIDAGTGLIEWITPNDAQGLFNFTLTVSNDQGDQVTQQIALTVCTAKQPWDPATKTCPGPIKITSQPPIGVANSGDAYRYPVTATNANHLPVTYSLSDAPAGMKIDPSSGLIQWTVQAKASGLIGFTVNARDSKGAFDEQAVGLRFCAAPESWDRHGCKGPIAFTSTPITGADVGQTFHYQVAASHANKLTMTYSLADTPMPDGRPTPTRPEGMTIDPQTGLVSWSAQSQLDTDGQAYFSIIATDSNGYKASLDIAMTVCEAPTNWDQNLSTCRGPVRITSTPPVSGLDVGQIFDYQVSATDTNSKALPISYRLTDASVASITINQSTGLIHWTAEDLTEIGGAASFTITATDKLGQQEQQYVTVYTCAAPQHWNPDGYCN